MKTLIVKCMGVPPVRRLAMLIRAATDDYLAMQVLETAVKLSARADARVIFGPFTGMIYPPDALMSLEYARKVLGTYESELHTVIESLRGKPYDLLVNIGAAEGYYAVGLTQAFPTAHMIAYETDEDRRGLCKAMADANGVSDRIELRGCCTIEDLRSVVSLPRNGLIVSDCEGCEWELLSPDYLPELDRFDMIIELHDFASCGPTASQIVAGRFAPTHRVTIVNMRPEKPTGHLDATAIDRAVLRRLVDEGRRFSVGWAFLESRLWD